MIDMIDMIYMIDPIYMHHSPSVECTNAAERKGNGPLLDRYCLSYVQRFPRLVQHEHTVNRDAINHDKQNVIVKEIQHAHVLSIVLSKLQECGVVPMIRHAPEVHGG